MRKFDALMATADTNGDWEEMPWLAGQGVGLIHEIRPAKDVVETMMAGAKAILRHLSGSLERPTVRAVDCDASRNTPLSRG